MKRLLFLIVVSAILFACSDTDSKTSSSTAGISAAQKDRAFNDSVNYTTIQWLDSTHQELGKIKEGQTPELTWRFKNVGDKPLIIINAQGTCGCTVAEKPEQPVAPGEEGVIKAKFSSEGRVGPNNKQVIVTTNTKGTSTHYLNFQVEVEKK